LDLYNNPVGSKQGAVIMRDSSDLIELTPARSVLWRDSEVGALLRHQLDSSIEPELSEHMSVALRQLRDSDECMSWMARTFRQVLQDRGAAPMALLSAIKEYGKLLSQPERFGLPAQVGQTIYLLAIAAGLVRCGQRITASSDAELRAGFAWAAEQNWLDDELRSLLNDALAKVSE
jgi:hypothetical protein